MATFVQFKNANAPYEGKKISIDVDSIMIIYEDPFQTKGGKTTLWNAHNMWTVQESYATVMKRVKEAKEV